MSLLLLFPSAQETGFCWTCVNGGPTTWTKYKPGFRHRWIDWASYTWLEIGNYA